MGRYVANGIRTARRLVVGVIGATVLLGGLALLVLPGPALVVIPIGLGILAVEFEWARRWLRRARSLYETPSKPTQEARDGSLESGSTAPRTPADLDPRP